jgi:hypothetical protein
LKTIYERVDEEGQVITDMRKDKISLDQAISMSEQLHAKFRGGLVRDNADALEKTNGKIKDLLDHKIQLRSPH